MNVIQFGYFLIHLSHVDLIIRPAKGTLKGLGKFLPLPNDKIQQPKQHTECVSSASLGLPLSFRSVSNRRGFDLESPSDAWLVKHSGTCVSVYLQPGKRREDFCSKCGICKQQAEGSSCRVTNACSAEQIVALLQVR